MNKKRTKTIRILLALLVMLTIGGTQRAWADDLSDINGAMTVTPTGWGTAEVKNYNNNVPGYCYYLYTELYVAPAPGYSTRLSKITATNSGGTKVFPKFSSDNEDNVKTVDPADATGNYGSSRTIKIYWGDGNDVGCPNPQNIKITVVFEEEHLQLTSNLGGNATVTFYAGGTDPTTFDVSNPGTPITKADAGDWIVTHIEPDPGYWTDLKLLMVYEAGGSLSRTRGIGFDDPYKPILLQADTYVDAESNTKPRHDGAGWYYYQIPAEHTVALGFTSNVVDGPVVRHFSFTDDDAKATIAQDFDNNTVTVGRTDDDWTAVLTYDKFVWPFSGTIGALPHVQSISIQKGGAELIKLTDGTLIDILVDPDYTAGMPTIGDNDLKPTGGAYGWFVGRDDRFSGQTRFIIEPPFQPVDDTKPTNTWGSPDNPWAIASADDLNMLAKCVNVGGWAAPMQYFKQTANIVYDAAANDDFEPIGADQYCESFQGHYSGKDFTITGINYTCIRPKDSDGTEAYVGLFGNVSCMGDMTSAVEDVTLIDCKFRATSESCAALVGSVVASATGSGSKKLSITGCKVLATSDGSALVSSLSSANCATGAIIGAFASSVCKVENNYYGYGVTVTNTGGTASGYTKRGTGIPDTYDSDTGLWTFVLGDITASDGAMLWVKKATVPSENANGSKVEFNEVTKGTDRYDHGDDDFYYAVGQPVTLKVTTGTSSDGDIRTFYDELKKLTVTYVTTPPGTTPEVTTTDDITTALSFTMPEADATVAATFKLSDWFTIRSNNQKWMSFYHNWESANDQRKYTVSDGSGTGKTVKTLTINSVDIEHASFETTPLTEADGNGGTRYVSYYGVPTLFCCMKPDGSNDVLPVLLRFDPNTTARNTAKTADEFKGTSTVKNDLSGDGIYMMNGDGDFIRAYLTETEKTLAAHHCYINLNGDAALARLHNAGETNGISAPTIDIASEGSWYTLDGRKLNGKPTRKGIYINNGKKIAIK